MESASSADRCREIAREIAQVHAAFYGTAVDNLDIELGERFIVLMMESS
jgi:hypothetical protein